MALVYRVALPSICPVLITSQTSHISPDRGFWYVARLFLHSATQVPNGWSKLFTSGSISTCSLYQTGIGIDRDSTSDSCHCNHGTLIRNGVLQSSLVESEPRCWWQTCEYPTGNRHTILFLHSAQPDRFSTWLFPISRLVNTSNLSIKELTRYPTSDGEVHCDHRIIVLQEEIFHHH